MLESYEAYGDYNSIGDLTRELVQKAALAVAGSTVVRHHDGSEFDLGGDWEQITLFQGAVIRARRRGHGRDATVEAAGLRGEVRHRRREPWTRQSGRGTIRGTRRAEPGAADVCQDYPEETSPLVRGHRTEPGLAGKWDLYVRGFELRTGYSELVDPVIQRGGSMPRRCWRPGATPRRCVSTRDFLRAMEHGLPPMGGMGMGIDPADDGAHWTRHPGDDPVSRWCGPSRVPSCAARRRSSHCRPPMNTAKLSVAADRNQCGTLDRKPGALRWF